MHQWVNVVMKINFGAPNVKNKMFRKNIVHFPLYSVSVSGSSLSCSFVCRANSWKCEYIRAVAGKEG